MNQATILRFGSTFEFVEAALRRDGYALEWACTHDGGAPDDLPYRGHEGGWKMRRIIKEWCVRHEVTKYKIVRNRGYVADLHGIVYELWIHETDSRKCYNTKEGK